MVENGFHYHLVIFIIKRYYFLEHIIGVHMLKFKIDISIYYWRIHVNVKLYKWQYQLPNWHLLLKMLLHCMFFFFFPFGCHLSC